MKENIVRIKRIEINNFKNVEHGNISFETAKKGGEACILGLYGQNGSGKTALVDALKLLRFLLSGHPIPSYFADFVNVNSEYAMLKYDLEINCESKNSIYKVYYEVKLRHELEGSDFNTAEKNFDENKEKKYKAVVYDEVLSASCSCTNEAEKFRKTPIVDTRTSQNIISIPATKLELLIGNEEEVVTSLLLAKKYTYITSRSFIFSREFLEVVRQNCQDAHLNILFESLVRYGNFKLFVFDTSDIGIISMNALPLAFSYKEEKSLSIGTLVLKLNEPMFIRDEEFELIKKLINCMNIVLQQLVPGLIIDVKDFGGEISSNGVSGRRIQLMSKKNGKEIPLRYESGGIKKIISILQLLIAVYNNPSITLIVDELDSGVFEYLLGEILRIIAEKGKGQLIFTSHNLRPLEVLDKNFIAFTTTNPKNRYIRLSNVKASNNLRDFYYRDIVLGEQSEPVYDMTNNSEIAMAFREAGILSGS